MKTPKSARKRKAKERKAERALLSSAEQLRRLDERFGEGLGAQKERARLRLLV